MGLNPAAASFLNVVKEGRSFSGRERHCVFLNTGGRRFADVSAISGLDLSDDGRGVAWVDWDKDGDLDVWVSNRNGPQVRFLQNQSASESGFVAFRLQGRQCNRDAIGARVEVQLRNTQRNPLLKTLRAGDGFLSQSSKWLHFGVGDDEIQRVTVRWPGGAAEDFAGVERNAHYTLRQGDGTAKLWRAAGRRAPLPATPLKLPTSQEVAQVFSAGHVQLPTLHYETFDGAPSVVRDVANPSSAGGPVLLNLWASWCGPCVKELREIAAHQRQLEREGLDVVALSVDALDPSVGSIEAAQSLLKEIRFPFRSGLATDRLAGTLQSVHDHLFELHRTLPVPSSFLLDAKGRLAAIYKGPVTVEKLLDDVRRLDVDRDQRWRASLPFPGRWMATEYPDDHFQLVLSLAANRQIQDLSVYPPEYARQIEQHPRFTELALPLGERQEERGDHRAALQLYRTAFLKSPGLAAAIRLIWLHATSADDAVRDGPAAMLLAKESLTKTNHPSSQLLDAVAAAHAEVGRFDEAVSWAEKAHAAALEDDSGELADAISQRHNLYNQHRRFRQTAATPIDPR